MRYYKDGEERGGRGKISYSGKEVNIRRASKVSLEKQNKRFAGLIVQQCVAI